MSEETLFQEALAKSPAERAAFLDQACAGQPELRAAVEALLAAHEAAGSFMEPPTDEPGDTGPYVPDSSEQQPPAAKEVIGTRIGQYKLAKKLGEGGMGAVYLAEQEQPVRRQVALKIIKAGMDSADVLARFTAERQALAVMDHPHIAKVFDAGTSENGQPFFVMELVQGVPVTKFSAEHDLALRERLRLFIAVCQAVQHAHQKGIIHRDLKPSNVLVAELDGRPAPKVIDFGIAKATGERFSGETLHTQIGAVLGTLEYMSPEQAELTDLDIDTRSDIYSLGVILYELLTGSTPLERTKLRGVPFTEILRRIREEEPPRPSVRLGADQLAKQMRAELDWVVMKCLEKQRDRRYETANALARDIRHYLADEPVEARPPSRGYRLKKFVQRNKIQVVAASLALLALLAGMVGTSVGLVEARRQEGIARNEATAKENARAAEARQRTAAEKRLQQIDKGNMIITAIFTDLNLQEVRSAREPLEAVLAKRLVDAGTQLEGESVGDPLVVAELQMRLGRALIALSYPNEAIGLCVKARETLTTLRGSNHPDTLTSMGLLASANQDAGKLDLALPLYEETLRRAKATLGPDHPATLDSMNNIALAYKKAGKLELALPLFEEALRLSKAKQGPDHPSALISTQNLAQAYQAAGKLELALPLFEETLRRAKATLGAEHLATVSHISDLALAYQAAGKLDLSLPLLEQILRIRRLKLGSVHSDTLHSMGELAHAYQLAGKLDLALPLFEEVLKLFRATLGPDHPDTVTSMGHLASAYHDAAKLDLAIPLYLETLNFQKAKLGADHSATLSGMNNLALAYRDVGKLELALPLWEETLKLTKAKLGPDHPDTLNSMSSLALAYREAEKLDLAFPLYEETLKLMNAKLGADHPETLTIMNNLGMAYLSVGKLELSLPLLEETLRRKRAKLGDDHPATLDGMNNLALAYRDAGKLDQALPLFEETLKLRKTKHGTNHPSTLICMNNLASTYAAVGRLELAVPLYEETFRLKKAKLGADHPSTLNTLAGLGWALLTQKKWAAAESVLRECLAHRQTRQPNVWSTFDTQAQLGGALLGQKRYAEAEPLLLKGYEGMKQQEKTLPAQGKARLTEALERLVQLYDAVDKKEEAAKWRKELEAIRSATPKPEKQR